MSEKGSEGKEMTITFKAHIIPAKEFPKNLHQPEDQAREGIFGVQELEIGGENFVAVFGRSYMTST